MFKARSSVSNGVLGFAAVLITAGISVMCSSGGSKTDEANGGGPAAGGSSSGGSASGGNAGSTGGSAAGGASAMGGAAQGGSPGTGGGGTGGTPGTGGTAAVCNGVPKLKLTPVVTDASDPILITQPIGDTRLFVVERRGVIRLVGDGGKVSATPFADLRNNVANPGNSERGLLGLAFHPAYATNGRFFVYYTAKNGDTVSGGNEGDLVIAEGKRSADPNKAEATLTMIKKIAHSTHSNHNGGMLNFGKDGFLYAGTGDGGSGGDPFKAGQDAKQALGKLLRIDVDKPTVRPAGNMPEPADIHVFAIGLRNPWRWSFDRATGDLYIGDVGQDAWEEVDYVKAADVKAGINFGWSSVEGKHCYTNNCDMGGKIAPVIEYANPPGNDARSVTGGFVYRGSKIPCLVGRYIYADDIINKVYSFVIANGQASGETELTADLTEGGVQIGDVAAFGEDNAGELYLVARAAGRIYKIEAQ
ncbi:MAG: PQQ-dependent sugar dehydrogenase [Deltaproteobacteria bacterium]|nr:PQQ-dependent sugar dehydrogenase [Deltaproteobacteria bacterium]